MLFRDGKDDAGSNPARGIKGLKEWSESFFKTLL